MSAYFATKGLSVLMLSTSRYVVQDELGYSSVPNDYKDIDDLKKKLQENFGVRLLVPKAELHPLPSLSSFQWQQLEHWYVAHLDYALYDYVHIKDRDQFNIAKHIMPLAYLEYGYGNGSREGLEKIDKLFRTFISNGRSPLPPSILETWLVLEQFKRIFKELMSLIHRAIDSFLDLLVLQRRCIHEAIPSLDQLDTNEVIHHGRESYRASTAASMAVISLCTSLDIQSKLIHYLDQVDITGKKFKPAGGRHFSDLRKFKPTRLPREIPETLLTAVEANSAFAELIQFRHDIVHSTSAIELEKVYVGFGTPEIKEMPLHYSFQSWRDCTETGQPERYLLRFLNQFRGIAAMGEPSPGITIADLTNDVREGGVQGIARTCLDPA